jgi:hypothetical protein
MKKNGVKKKQDLAKKKLRLFPIFLGKYIVMSASYVIMKGLRFEELKGSLLK